MDICIYNLDDYLDMKKYLLSIDKMRKILIQLNEIFEISEKEIIIFKDLKLSNILITYSKIDEIKIKLNKIITIELIDKTKSYINCIKGICLKQHLKY